MEKDMKLSTRDKNFFFWGREVVKKYNIPFEYIESFKKKISNIFSAIPISEETIIPIGTRVLIGDRLKEQHNSSLGKEIIKLQHQDNIYVNGHMIGKLGEIVSYWICSKALKILTFYPADLVIPYKKGCVPNIHIELNLFKKRIKNLNNYG